MRTSIVSQFNRVAEMSGPVRSLLPALAAFTIASALAVGLVAARIVVTGRVQVFYLVWNLSLAWLPLVFAVLVWREAETRPPRRTRLLLGGAAWLLFFPNAPYIFTDLTHLAKLHGASTAPPWFDLLLHLVFAMIGLMLGFASLALMQNLVARARGKLAGWGFALAVLALAGFGIYLGRFLRWHSWDALFSPLALASDIANRFITPVDYARTWGFSAVCFVFLLVSYLMCSQLGQLRLSAHHDSPKPE